MSVAKNTAFMTIASVFQKIIAFGYFAIIARSIGAEGTGKYFFALSFTTIFVVFVDLGLTNVMVREGAKLKTKLQEYFSAILFVKFFLSILTYAAAIIVINAMGYPVETKHLVYISGITMLFDSLHLSLYGTLRAIGNLKYEAIGMVVSQLITLILGSIFLYFGLPLIYLMVAFLIPSILNVLFAYTVVHKKYQIKLKLKYDKKVLKYIIPIVIPFALAGIFGRVYSYIDSVLLSKLAGDVVVGWYSIPYKVAYAFQFIPMALVAALYPRFSEYFVHDKEKLHYVFHQGIKYLLLVALPLVVGISLLSREIVTTLFTDEYINSILPLQILMIGIVFSYLNFHFGALLNACNKQVTQTVLIGVVMVMNIGLNIALIPQYGAVGAALAAVLGNIGLMLMSLFIVPKITKFNVNFLIQAIARLALSAGVMGAAVWYTNIHMGLVFAIFVGLISYPVMLFITRAVTRKQFDEMVSLVRK
ncbi:oligosaccharide flippase family protein [Candidatus Parcubacteria bacterium]|jgi:O-antigen/teichoic acid export membrane protein|nr:oligosaccharide flippase family protein [Candidatus Parcubacteria bacterium]